MIALPDVFHAMCWGQTCQQGAEPLDLFHCSKTLHPLNELK